MKRCFFLSVGLGIILLVAGCVGSGNVSTISPQVNRVALVSLSVNDWGGSVKFGSVGSEDAERLIYSGLEDMVDYTEQKLAGKWQVTKVAGFIGRPEYRKIGVERTLTAYLPKIDGNNMPIFTQVSKELKSGTISADKARELCKIIDVDAVALVFSEWTYKTGGIVPTTKAVSKNIITIWDNNGREILHRRVDMMGKRTIGAYGVKALNQDTILEWTDTFKRSLDKIFAGIA